MSISTTQLFLALESETARMDKVRENNPHVLMSEQAFREGYVVNGRKRANTAFTWFFQLILSAFFPKNCTGVHCDTSTFFEHPLRFSSRSKRTIKEELKDFLSFVGNFTDISTEGHFRSMYNTQWRRVFNPQTENDFIKVFPVKVNREELKVLVETIIPEHPERFMIVNDNANNKDAFYDAKEPFKVFYYNAVTRTFLGFYYKKQIYETDITQNQSSDAMIPKFYQILSGFLINQGIKDNDPRYTDLDKFKKEYAYEIETLNTYGSLSLYATYDYETGTYSETVRTQPATAELVNKINQIKGFFPELPEYLERWKKVLRKQDTENSLRTRVSNCNEALAMAMNVVLEKQLAYDCAVEKLNAFLNGLNKEEVDKKAIAVYSLLTSCKNIIRFLPNDKGVYVEMLQDIHFGNDHEFEKVFAHDKAQYTSQSPAGQTVINAMRTFMLDPNSRFTFVGFSAFDIQFDSSSLPNTRYYPDTTNRNKYPGNPHFTHHNCYGSFGTTITQCMQEKDYDTAIQLMLEAASGINAYEAFTVKIYIEECIKCMNSNHPFIRDLKTNELISIDEAYRRAAADKLQNTENKESTESTGSVESTENTERKSLAD